MRYWLLLLLSVILFSCENKDLYYGSEDEQLIQIRLHWGEEASIPGSMRINLFTTAGKQYKINDVKTHLDNGIALPLASSYQIVSYDYFESENIDFRHEDDLELLEAYCMPDLRSGKRAYSAAGEETVLNPGRLFVSRIDTFDVVKSDTALVMNFYPENIVYSYTFRITGVKGINNIESARGSISGMSASYFFATGELSTTPSTILFSLHPDAANNEITGLFRTFGLNSSSNRLTIELYNSDGKEFSKQWEVLPELLEAKATGTFYLEIGDAGIEVTPGEKPASGSGFDVRVDKWKDRTIKPLGF